MTLLRAARLNAVASYFNFFVASVVTLVVSPLLVGYLGSAGFGTWKAMQKLMDFGTVADGRSSQALKWIIASNARLDRPIENRQAVGSALVVWLMFLPVTALAAGAVIWLMPSLIHDAPISAETMRLIGGLLALNLLLVPLLGLPDAVLVGENRGYASMSIQTATFIAANCAMVFVASRGFGLTYMALVTLAATVVNALLVFLRARYLVDWLGVAKPTRAHVKKFFGFSGWVLVWSLVSKLLLATDLILLGALVGASAVADYTFTAYAPQFAIAVCFMTGSAAMPGIGSLMKGADRAKLATAVTACRSIVLVIATIMCCGILLFNRTFVQLWAGGQHFLGDAVNLFLAFTTFQLILIRNESQIQDVTLSIRAKVLIGGGFALLSLVLAAALYRASGGQVWGIFAGLLLARLPLMILFSRMVDGLLPQIARNWKTVVLAASLLSLSWVVSAVTRGLSLWPLLAIATATFLGLVALSVACLLDTQTRSVLLSRVCARARNKSTRP